LLFYVGLVLSAILLLWPGGAGWIDPLLIITIIAGVLTGVATGLCEIEGNSLKRSTQIGDALGVPLGGIPDKGYYNTNVPHSIIRLGVTSFENAFFTSQILHAMLRRRRIVTGAYIVVLVLLLSLRWASLGWLVLLTQGVFSTAIVAYWLRMEIFRYRTKRLCDEWQHFFLQKPSGTAADLAIILHHFTAYECAKDEAGMPLDSQIFDESNARLSAGWKKLSRRLGIDK
jgi:hypothetical protein